MSTTHLRYHIHAPRAAVYRALLDAHAVQTWQVPTGMTSRVHHFEAREGGTFRISLTYDTPGAAGKTTAHTDTHHGRFVKLVPDEQVVQVLEFETDDPALRGEMTITMTLVDADGGTDLVAVHEGVPSAVPPADNELGWRLSLAKLAALVEASVKPPASQLVLAAHDPSWAARFAQEAAAIRHALGDEALAVEHIGSTSVPGLIAKPILDILVGLRRVPPSDAAVRRMEALGYRSRGAYGLPERAYFTRPGVHAHGYEIGRGQWDSHLLFRDYLRSVDAAREAYAQAKRALFEEGNGDYEHYVTRKEAVVTRLLVDAARWDRAGRG